MPGESIIRNSAWGGYTARTPRSPSPSRGGGGCRGCGAVAGVGGPRALCRSVPQESHWAHVQSTATQKTLLLGQIKLAVLNLFQLATARLEVPTDVALEDTEAQLDMVSAALSPGQRGWDGHGDIRSRPRMATAPRSLSPQVLLCMQDLAAISAELRPRQQGPCPPRLPIATSISPLHHGGARVPPSQE